MYLHILYFNFSFLFFFWIVKFKAFIVEWGEIKYMFILFVNIAFYLLVF